MKARLHLRIDEDLLLQVKAYAAKRGIGVSELAEDYFKSITRPAKRKNIITLVDSLKKPDIEKQTDLKELFYQGIEDKYLR